MLPIPFENFIPKLLKDHIDASGQALCDFMDDFISDLKDDTLNVYLLKIPERCPNSLLNELGYFLNAGFKDYDSEATKRLKVYSAIQGHKIRGSWIYDAKNRIDAITGYSADIFIVGDNDDCIELAQEADDPDYYWSTESGYDGSDDNLGTWEVGDFTEYVIEGNMSINCHEGIYTAVLSAAQIAQIVTEIEDDVVPAYMAVYLGYVNSMGQFVEYAGGRIHVP